MKQKRKNDPNKKGKLCRLLKLFCITLLFIFYLSPFTSQAQCPQALMEYAKRYPAAEPQDLYKLVFQDLYGPGHLLTDSADCARYLTVEIAQMKDIDTPLPPSRGDGVSVLFPSSFEEGRGVFPLYEYTLCDSNFVRVNLYLVKWGYISLEKMVSAVMRSAEGMPTPDHRFVMSHSKAFKAAYDPHYRIVRRDIFERDILPVISK